MRERDALTQLTLYHQVRFKAFAVGLLLAAILGLFAYMSATATPLHPNLQDVPSVTRSAPLPTWADAVAQGRQIVRAGLTEQNLPGISVAVGIGGDIVWAEGFGWADLDNRVPVAPKTRFRIGTASIALTSAAVGLLLEEGQLKLDDVSRQRQAAATRHGPITPDATATGLGAGDGLRSWLECER